MWQSSKISAILHGGLAFRNNRHRKCRVQLEESLSTSAYSTFIFHLMLKVQRQDSELSAC